MKMEQTECSETSAYKLQTPGYYPKGSIKHSKQLLEERGVEGKKGGVGVGWRMCLKNVNSQNSVTSRISESAATLLDEPHTLHH